jgi:cytochrome c oxidase subunit II
VQTTFAPHGPAARELLDLERLLIFGGALIFLLVLAAIAAALVAPHSVRRQLSRPRTIVAGGAVFPLIVLSALLAYALAATRDAIGDRREPALRIEVTGLQWWWRVRYLDAAGSHEFETANEVRIPVDRTIESVLRSEDVIHSFWIPGLAGKLDMFPGRTTTLRVRADRPGTLRGQCAEYCGTAHAWMALYAVVSPAEEFERWRQRQLQDAGSDSAARAEGERLFHAHGCGWCHTIRGTEAAGRLGPDLTHVGGRLSIGAATLPNNAGTIAGWIASNQHIKPGNLMPPIQSLSGPELLVLAQYLAELR